MTANPSAGAVLDAVRVACFARSRYCPGKGPKMPVFRRSPDWIYNYTSDGLNVKIRDFLRK